MLGSIREQFVKSLSTVLIGPLCIDETITEDPLDRYLCGVLWPTNINTVEHSALEFFEDERQILLNAGKDTAQNEESDGVPSSMKFKQSSMGISFQLLDSCSQISAEIEFGRYELSDSNVSDGCWRRQQKNYTIAIDFLHNHYPVDSDIYLHLAVSPNKGMKICTITLVNNSSCSSDRKSQIEASLFQPRLRICSVNEHTFQMRPIRDSLVNPESLMYEMLYRRKRPLASGHGVSVVWSDDSKSIETTYLPTYELSPIDNQCQAYFSSLDNRIFSAHELGSASQDDLIKHLNSFTTVYEQWIEAKREEIETLDSAFIQAAHSNLSTCNSALERIKIAVSHIANDNVFRQSFQLANLAIDLQSSWRLGNSVGSFRWRPFQLAFILLVIESFISESQPSRDVVDLLWFPTGGGKTEAYLGIVAFLLLRGAINHEENGDPGTQVLIRYTLRLLTKQQFERAACLVLAANLIKNNNIPASSHSKELSIGLWIGKESTPNSRADARTALLSSDISKSDPRQLLICPCCRSSLNWEFIRDRPVQPECANSSCSLYGPLPVYTVDEDIYNIRPSVVLGTSDKFVQIVQNTNTHNLFSSTSDRQPELILQDELHLISGPLGSIAGLFESAVDIICSRHAKAKIIGSTATIKNASSQISLLFNRSSLQFPPPGIDYADSCFAIEDRTMDGRLYIGISSIGRSPKYALQAIAATCYHAGSVLYDEYKESRLSDQADSYTTLVAYFNSLKELGGAAVLFQDDVSDSLATLALNYGPKEYELYNIYELTSTRSQDQLQAILSDLELMDGDPSKVHAVLATNMLSVGVDVSRLGLMLINGQPKSQSEFIQASSRVGRRFPGIVVTLYNDSKVRDKSGFENFTSSLSSLYKDVEISSVTPFSPQCLDRVLPSVLVAACRHIDERAMESPDIMNFIETIDFVSAELVCRCEQTDPENLTYLQESIKNIRAQWISSQATHYCIPSRAQRPGQIPLLTAAEKAILKDRDDYIFSMITNLRSVEAQTLIRERPSQRRQHGN